MMKHSIWSALGDVSCIFGMRMRLIRKDVITIIVLFTSVVLFVVMLRLLTVSAEELSSLPIGIIDEDYSESSEKLILGLQKVETLRIIEKSEEDLNKLLLDEMITSIFIIEKGYEKNLKAGKLDQIITMYYKEDNKSAAIIADIVAGEVIYPACFYKSLNYYEKLPYEGQKLSVADYQNYMKVLLSNNTDFDFAFYLNYSNPEHNRSAGENISNSILYKQFIIGIIGIMLSFITMFILSLTVKEREDGIELRLKTIGFHAIKRDLGNLGALFIWQAILSLIYLILIFYEFRLEDFRLWLSTYLLLLLNLIVIGGVMLLISKLIHQMITYQVVTSLLILLTGGLGFYHLLSGFYQGFLDIMVKFIPNSWFIKGFTDIMVYDSKRDIINEGHQALMVMSTFLIVLIISVDLIGEYHNLKISKKKNRMVNK